MMIVQRDRATLHVRNRILALVRLSSLSRERRSEGQAQKLRQLLDDLEEDLETMEEAKASVAPTQLALLGHSSLGTRHWTYEKTAVVLVCACCMFSLPGTWRLPSAGLASPGQYRPSSVQFAFWPSGSARPELFHLMGHAVRRMGIWSFSDREAASLLEGFSRAKRCDEAQGGVHYNTEPAGVIP